MRDQRGTLDIHSGWPRSDHGRTASSSRSRVLRARDLKTATAVLTAPDRDDGSSPSRLPTHVSPHFYCAVSSLIYTLVSPAFDVQSPGPGVRPTQPTPVADCVWMSLLFSMSLTDPLSRIGAVLLVTGFVWAVHLRLGAALGCWESYCWSLAGSPGAS